MHFQRKTADYFRSNFSSIQTLISRFGYHHFHYYATFLFKTPLNTLQHASVNHILYGKCVMLPQLNWGIRMAPNYPVNLRWRVIYWLVRSFRVVDVARILHVWQIFVKPIFFTNRLIARRSWFVFPFHTLSTPEFRPRTLRDFARLYSWWITCRVLFSGQKS